jgi:phosphoribosylaminoimidazole-succinocarboxamide synthase
VLNRPGKSPELVLADEVHTPDSSRYWLADTYEAKFAAGEDPDMLDKEFVRRWLIEQGYMGEGTPPKFTDEFRIDTAQRYMQLFEQVTGKPFQAEVGPAKVAVRDAVLNTVIGKA